MFRYSQTSSAPLNRERSHVGARRQLPLSGDGTLFDLPPRPTSAFTQTDGSDCREPSALRRQLLALARSSRSVGGLVGRLVGGCISGLVGRLVSSGLVGRLRRGLRLAAATNRETESQAQQQSNKLLHRTTFQKKKQPYGKALSSEATLPRIPCHRKPPRCLAKAGHAPKRHRFRFGQPARGQRLIHALGSTEN